jgi:hypothetical protein
MILIFQIFFIFFSLIAIYIGFQRKKQNLLDSKGFIFFTVFWILVILVVAWPESSNKIARILGIGRGSDLIIYVALCAISFVLFKINMKIEKINRDITKLVRKDAIKNSKEKEL